MYVFSQRIFSNGDGNVIFFSSWFQINISCELAVLHFRIDAICSLLPTTIYIVTFTCLLSKFFLSIHVTYFRLLIMTNTVVKYETMV